MKTTSEENPSVDQRYQNRSRCQSKPKLIYKKRNNKISDSESVQEP